MKRMFSRDGKINGGQAAITGDARAEKARAVNGRWELTTTTERRYRFRAASLAKNSKHNSLAAFFDGSFVRTIRREARLVRDTAVRRQRSARRFEESKQALAYWNRAWLVKPLNLSIVLFHYTRGSDLHFD